MLVIRNEQFHAFNEAAEEALVSRLAALMRTNSASACEGVAEEALRVRIRAALAAAGRHGIVGDHDRSRYVNMSFVLGAGFDRSFAHPWAAAILADERLDSSAKIAALHEKTLEALDAGGE